ncbi:MAG: AMP-binding protein, partial [Methylococcaceae bacterium]|nr:AMP-binding protein [Methylococcaceae bacterium]
MQNSISKNLLTAFNKQCLRIPEQPAFIEDSRCVNYAEFQQATQQLAAYLQQQNSNQQPIALFIERGIDAAIAIYAVLTIGASYLPLDTKNPLPRINFIIDDAQPQLIIGKGLRPKGLTEKFTWLDLDNFDNTLVLNEVTNTSPETLAAILYTSGSTGKPKGVALSHQAMLNFSSWAANTFKLTETDRLASLAPFHFDLSVFDLFSSLMTGASVVFVPARLTLSPSRLTTWLSDMQISTFYTVPSLLSFLALKGNLANTNLKTLRQILFAGEVFPTEPLTKLANLLPDTELYNLYGPTETNVCCYWHVDRNRLETSQNIPIGIAAAEAELSIAENGELWVKSLNNFSGYWQQGKLIARNLEDAYATGDKVSRNEH